MTSDPSDSIVADPSAAAQTSADEPASHDGPAAAEQDVIDVDDADEGDRDEPAQPRRIRRALRWLFWRRLCFGGLAGALVLFCLSMTPSLVPRDWLFQGAVSGVSAVIGYGLGSALSAGIRKVLPREPSDRFKRRGWWVLAAATLVLGVVFLYLGWSWQEDVRQLMEIEDLRAYEWTAILLLTVFLFALFLFIARLVRGGTRLLIALLDRFLPHHVTVIIGVSVSALAVAGFLQGVLFNGMVTTMNSAYSLADRDTSPWISRPSSELRSGSPQSLVEWDDLGQKGREFAGDGGGPTVEQIEAFTGESAAEPIRIYVGLRAADEIDARIDLALAELERTGAFDRSVLIVNTTTGTGWVDENVADSIEFLHGGDTAQVAMQYSYLPSWVSFLVDRSKAAETGEQLITAVVDRVNDMNVDERPQLLVFGESLGSFGTESAFTSDRNMLANVDGALLVGPTFVNPLHGKLTDERDPESPVWRPIFRDGESFRFAVSPDDLTDPELYPDDPDWTDPRVVYLQNSSDPITYFDPAVLWSEPAWLRGERGPDVSDSMTWIPIVTFWQIAADMAFSMDVPDGHGHRYGSNVVEGWVQLSAPEGWSDDDTQALRDLIDERAEVRSRRK